MLDEIMMMGVCAFCEHGTHDYPQDRRHERMHDEQGYHVCDVDGVFRNRKPLCEHMALKASVFVG